MENGMEYSAAELLLVVSGLADKYTSKESTSITWERAQTLMEAVLYCINQYVPAAKAGVVRPAQRPEAKFMYQKGYERVIEKTIRAKALYEEIIRDFEDYGVMNYRDTVIKGMPEFFRRYDPRFCPQDHLLTLDYPLLEGNLAGDVQLRGIDLILAYLQGIKKEKAFLEQFDRSAVVSLLEELVPDYQELYLDNICREVLFRAVVCAIAHYPVRPLAAEAGLWEAVRCVQGTDRRQTEAALAVLIGQMLEAMGIDQDYFLGAAAEFAFRLHS